MADILQDCFMTGNTNVLSYEIVNTENSYGRKSRRSTLEIKLNEEWQATINLDFYWKHIKKVDLILTQMDVRLDYMNPYVWLQDDQIDWYKGLTFSEDTYELEEHFDELFEVLDEIDLDVKEIIQSFDFYGEMEWEDTRHFSVDCEFGTAYFEIKEEYIANIIQSMIDRENYIYSAVFNGDIVDGSEDLDEATDMLKQYIRDALKEDEEIDWDECCVIREWYCLSDGQGSEDIVTDDSSYEYYSAKEDPEFEEYIYGDEE